MSRWQSEDNDNAGRSGRAEFFVALAAILILLGLVLSRCAKASGMDFSTDPVVESALNKVYILGDFTGPMVAIVAINGDTSLADGVTANLKDSLSVSLICFDAGNKPTWEISKVFLQALVPGQPGWQTVAFSAVPDVSPYRFRQGMAELCWSTLLTTEPTKYRSDVSFFTVLVDVSGQQNGNFPLVAGVCKFRGWCVDKDGYILQPPGFKDYEPDSHDSSSPEVVVQLK